MHALLVKRADELAGCTEGSPEVAGLAVIADAIMEQRWPVAKVKDGKS